MYNELKDIFQYLVSVRRLKNYLSIDIEFPLNWKIPKRFAQEDKIIENQKLNDNGRFFSFVCEFDETVVNLTVENIKNIILYNKEIELKERLLKQKIDELKRIFESKNLENLQTLKFELFEEKLDDGEEDFNEGGTGDRLVDGRDLKIQTTIRKRKKTTNRIT
jgi:hypothetical protein